MTNRPLPAPDYLRIVALYQQLGRHLLTAMQSLSDLQLQLIDILSLTHSNMLQTTHEHLTAFERSMEQASKAASSSVPRASVQTSVAGSATHH
eukprot:gene14941-14738_t